MAIATSIAITEYAMYKPVPVPETMDEETVSKFEDEATESSDEDSNESSGENEAAVETQSDSQEALPGKDLKPADTVSVQNQEVVDPFKTGGEKVVVINNGDTLTSLLSSLGFDKTEIYLASKSLSKVYNLKGLKIGQKITVRGKRDTSGELTLNGFELNPDYRYKIVVSKTDSGYSAEKIEVPVKKVVRNISGTIMPKSPEYSLQQCGVKPNISKEALRSLAQVANIRASKTPVDFEFLYSEFYDDAGNVVKRPELLYASFFVDGKIKRIYKFQDNGSSEYVDSNGTIIRTLASTRSMLSQPLSRMKITSRFGIRRHPVSGRVKGHTGVDLSAPVGTPIRAAASGVVTRASYYSGYGRYIKISHTGAINTAYGHLSKIIVRSGQHVSQGQIIGYTGNTGITTGPHLHYEVIKNGSFVNPLSFVKQEPQKLAGKKLRKFNQFKKEVNLQVVGLVPSKNKTVLNKKYS